MSTMHTPKPEEIAEAERMLKELDDLAGEYFRADGWCEAVERLDMAANQIEGWLFVARQGSVRRPLKKSLKGCAHWLAAQKFMVTSDDRADECSEDE